MSYVIRTTNETWEAYAAQYGRAEAFERAQQAGGWNTSRQTVATLAEAQQRAAELVDHAYDRGDPFGDGSGLDKARALDIPERGGSVGPLPDGTIITVKPYA